MSRPLTECYKGRSAKNDEANNEKYDKTAAAVVEFVIHKKSVKYRLTKKNAEKLLHVKERAALGN